MWLTFLKDHLHVRSSIFTFTAEINQTRWERNMQKLQADVWQQVGSEWRQSAVSFLLIVCTFHCVCLSICICFMLIEVFPLLPSRLLKIIVTQSEGVLMAMNAWSWFPWNKHTDPQRDFNGVYTSPEKVETLLSIHACLEKKTKCLFCKQQNEEEKSIVWKPVRSCTVMVLMSLRLLHSHLFPRLVVLRKL